MLASTPESEGRCKSGRHFIAGFFGAALLFLLSLPVFNAVVDPYDAFHLWQAVGFNSEKTELLSRGGRVEKSLRLREVPFETVLVGSSRVLVGMDPQSPHLDDNKTYNAGLGGTNMYELSQVIEYIARHQPDLEQLIIGLDFSMFNDYRTVNGDYEVSGFAGRTAWQLYSYLLFSQAASLDSLDTLVSNLAGGQDRVRRDGYQDAPPLDVLEPGSRPAFAAVIDQFRDDDETFAGLAADGRYDAERLDMLRDALIDASSRSIEIKIFISPIHVLLIETMHRMGIAALYEQWKRDLVDMVEQINVEGRAAVPIQVWDFGDYNSITTEDVPQPGQEARMRWYWEPSHYRREVSELVLARMLDDENARDLPEDFGVLLTPQTIDLHSRRMRAAQAAYRAGHAADIESLVEDSPAPVIASEGVPASADRW